MAHLAHYREAHPLVFVITHWINLICMLILILTGFYIHYPLFGGLMGVARGAHMFCAFVILLNLVFRIIAAFFVKTASAGGTRTDLVPDIKNFMPQKNNRHQLGPWIKYYLFIKKDHPKGAKYGVPQKLAYLAVPFMILFMGLTGFCLWGPTENAPLFLAFTNMVGGLMIVRIIHYCVMWVIIIFTLIHIYLANIEGTSPSAIIFKWKEHGGLTYDPKTNQITGEDDLGHSGH